MKTAARVAVRRALKRTLDIAASSAGIVALSPALAAIGVAVVLDTPGPVLYGHERVGRGGRRFLVWKFRTMVSDADKLGGAITSSGDPRVTKVGKVLRRSKLDELPQLYNVLIGEMSLVGPRPEAPQYVEKFAHRYRFVLTVRPGITDEASIRFRNEEAILGAADDAEREYLERVLPAKLDLYEDYVRHPSISRDLSILVRTLEKVLIA